MNKEDVKELVPPGQPLPESGNPDAPAAPVPNRLPVKCGYAIGVREDGSFVFDIIGTDPGIIELLGLHKIAKEKLESRLDYQLKGKWSSLVDKIDMISSSKK